jgi:hypothetical protein
MLTGGDEGGDIAGGTVSDDECTAGDGERKRT